MSIIPISYLICRAVRKHRTPEDAADEIVTVHPVEHDVRPKAYFLSNQLDRVRLVRSKGGIEQQVARITGAPASHAPTLAFLYRNATLLGGSLFAGRSRRQLTSARPPRRPCAVRTEMDEAALVGTPISHTFFGHYMVDDAATALLARDFGPARSLESKHRAGWTHAEAYRGLMGLETPPVADVFLSRAWVFQDYGMNANMRGRMRQVRQRLAGLPADRSGHSVFIVRASSGQYPRVLENEAALAELLVKRGFVVVDPSRETAEDIIRKISGAALVVSVEGSALAHAYLTMRERGAMVTIQPPYRFENIWKDFTDLLGMRYGFVVGEGGPESFRVDPDDVLRTIDLVTG